MKYNNRLFPHPVLGIEDDVLGEFGAEMTYRSDKDYITLSVNFKLVEETLLDLIKKSKASFLIQIYCRGTMYREVFKTTSTISDQLQIQSVKLSGEVEVHFFICAETDINSYLSKNFNPEYLKTAFDIERSDILAYGGKAKFVANKSPDELKSVSSLIRIKNSEKKSKPMYNEYEGEKIEIMLCEEDYENYQLSIRNIAFVNLIHSCIVLPALVDALHFLDKEEAKEFEERRWHKALNDWKTRSKVKDPFQIAQNILDQPTERAFGTIINLMGEL